MIKKLLKGIVFLTVILILLVFCKIQFIGKLFNPSLFEPYLIKKTDSTHHVQLTYLGTSGLIIGYHGKQVVCDPFFSNPNLISSAFGRISYPKLSDKIDSNLYQHVDMITVSHGHYDHCLDIGNFLKQTSSTIVLADSSILNELHSVLKKTNTRQHPVSWQQQPGWAYSNDSIFRILPLASTHSPHFGHTTLFKGNYKYPLESLPEKLWQWKLYTCNSYAIDIMDKNEVIFRIIIVNGYLNTKGIAELTIISKERNANVLFPVFWKKSVCVENVERSYQICQPNVMILQHWNNLFRSNDKPLQYLRSTELPEFLQELNKRNIRAKIMLPFSTVEL